MSALYISERKFQSHIEAARREGMAMTAADLRKNAPSADENAGPEYQQAFHYLATVDKEHRDYIKAYQPGISVEDFNGSSRNRMTGTNIVKTVRLALEKHSLALRHLDRATEKPRMDFNRKWEQGAALLFPEYASLKESAQLLGADAAIKILGGDVEGGIARLSQVNKLAGHCFQEPTLIAQLVGIAIQARNDRIAIQLMGQHQNNPKVVAAIAKYLAEPVVRADYLAAVSGEAFFMVSQADLVAAGTSDMMEFQDEEYKKSARWLRIKWIRRQAQIKVLDSYRRVYKELKKSKGDWRKAEAALRDTDDRILTDKSIVGSLSNLFYVPFSTYGTTSVRSLNLRNMARMTAELIQIKQQTGSFPSMVPNSKHNLDNQIGAPFTYRREGDGFILYGTDVDGRDDGGKSRKDLGVLFTPKEAAYGLR